MWKNLACIAIAGGAGTCARFGLVSITQKLASNSRIFGSAVEAARLTGTLAVNVIGCFLFGLIWSMLCTRLRLQGQTQQIIFVGFLGAFTTFSTYAFEVSNLIRLEKWALAATTLIAHNALGILAVLIGIVIGKMI